MFFFSISLAIRLSSVVDPKQRCGRRTATRSEWHVAPVPEIRVSAFAAPDRLRVASDAEVNAGRELLDEAVADVEMQPWPVRSGVDGLVGVRVAVAIEIDGDAQSRTYDD